ncbi:hypothetical protein C8R46DRAFT_1293728 [Mycena filopes]|nr:hypothetical protein C8R46DRAFT_1293728 [Mycena filopes]
MKLEWNGPQRTQPRPPPTTASSSSPTFPSEVDPFRRAAAEDNPVPRFDSQTSWLTSTNGTHKTVSAWSYPTEGPASRNGSSINLTAKLLSMANANVLGGYGLVPVHSDVEKSLAALAAALGATVYRAVGWLIAIWVPLAFSLPYLVLSQQNAHAPTIASILLILSVTLSSPPLALNLLRLTLSATLLTGAACAPTNGRTSTSAASARVSRPSRAVAAATSNGDAVNGKSKMSRALGMITPMPKLSLLPLKEDDSAPLTPPLPMQNDDDSSLPVVIHNSTQDETRRPRSLCG